jgi:hypothetical protein
MRYECGVTVQRIDLLLWVVDKKIVRHLIECDGRMADVPIRVSYEYAVDEGSLVEGSLTLKTLYDKATVCRCFSSIDEQKLEEEVQVTVKRTIDEHLALAGLGRPERGVVA